MRKNLYRYSFTFHRFSDGCKLDEQEFEVKQVSPEHPARTAMNLATTYAAIHSNALWHVDPKTSS